MRILVTGGAGFLGSHLVERLIARGDAVTVLDDLSTGRREHVAAVPDRCFVHGCVTDARLVERLVGNQEQVFHLAAVVGVQKSLASPVRAMRVNADGTATVLAACARRRTPLLLTSSSEVYGDAPRPVAEEAPLAPGALSRARGGYACSKAYGEWLALAHAREDGLPVVVARLFNVIGPRQSDAMVVPRFVRQALAGGPLTIHGDGSQRRCFADAGEVADALLALAACPAARGRAVNVGGANELSVIDLARAVCDAVELRVPFVHVPLRDAFPHGGTDIARRVPVLDLLRALIGTAPSRPIADTLADVVAERRAGLAVAR
ncbi:MAG: NAD-dependent epimerase/dehydratase family protein [Planctomycetes bacterium]|nr:NAD-dependent epimerase/dehydratase family protein [Planctomycetota bacterium]